MPINGDGGRSLLLSELIDCSLLQKLVNLRYEVTGIPVGIADADGRFITKAGWQDICIEFHRKNAASCRRCESSDETIKSHIADGKPFGYKCENGLWDIAMPIVIETHHVGTIFLGQFFYDDEHLDESFFERQAAEFRFDRDAYMKALSAVPRFSHKTIAAMLEYNNLFLTFISEQGLAKLRLKKEIELRQSAEKVLRDSEERFRRIIDTAGDVMTLVDESGTVTYTSPAITKSTGFEPAELLHSLWDVVHEDDIPVVQREMKRSLEFPGMEVVVRFRHVVKGGGYVWMESKAKNFLDDPYLRSFVVFTRDISELMDAQRMYMDKAEELDRFFNANLDLLCIADMQGYFRRLNPQWEAALGYTTAELTKKRFIDLVHPDDVPATLEAMSVLADQRAVLNFTNRYRRKTGEYRFIEWRSFPVGDLIYASARDITNKIVGELALKKSNELLQTIVTNIPVVLFVLDVNGIFLFSEGKGLATLDMKPGEVVGRSVFEVYADNEGMLGPIRESLGGKACSVAMTVGTRQYDVWLEPVFGEKGLLDRVIGVAMDVTERNRAVDERLAMERQLLHTQKLESLGVLAGGIAHDFNNILTAIVGHANLVQLDLPVYSPVRENIDEIVRAAQRASDLARQMLAYSGRGKFIVGSVLLNDLVMEMTHLISVSVSKKVLLRYEYAENLPAIEGDATQIRQVILNLITNASEAIGDKSGVIAVRTGAMDCSANYIETCNLSFRAGEAKPTEGLYVYIEVSDTGCGMDAETQDKIFDPFFTTKFTGRGLGLAAVLGIVRGHRGLLKMYSEPNRGTTFKILFPSLDPHVAVDADPVGQSGNVLWKGAGTVLLADDDESIRALGKQMLERLGFKVLTAEDGKEALSLCELEGDTISCVLLDMTMPHLDGEAAFRELKLLGKNIPVILCSGYTELEVTQRFIGKGLAGFLQKPYSIADLSRLLRSVLDR